MNNHTKSFTFSGRIRSIKHALEGLFEMFKSQHNAWVHLAATLATISLGAFLQIQSNEWAILVIAIILVWVCEALNTAFELLCDVTSPEFHPMVKKSKDVAAGAVLLSAFGATIVGVIIFAPYLLNLD